ncbi:hypothetical protein [Natronorarus salvus]|uniref:hypothetical protein n=1 Tax=Natronorarus salvus TaxID=3117733 RepID=UPI002F268E26
MTERTENRGYHLPRKGKADWHTPLNENFEGIDADVQAALDEADGLSPGDLDGEDISPESVETDVSRGQEGSITWNVPSDYPTVSDAFDAVDRMRLPVGISLDIVIESGHDLRTFVSRSQSDYRNVRIRSEGDVVGLSPDFGGRNVFQFSDHCAAPRISILLDGEVDGEKHPSLGFRLSEASTMTIDEGCGAINCDGGIYAMFGSVVNGFRSVFSSHRRRGVNVTNGSSGYFQEARVDDCGDFGARIGEARCQVHFADARGCGTGVWANQGALVGAAGVDVSGSGTGINVHRGVVINARAARIDDCSTGVIARESLVNLDGARSGGCGKFLDSQRASTVSCHGVTVNGTADEAIRATRGSAVHFEGAIENAGGSGILARGGSRVNAEGRILDSDGWDVEVQDGSIVHARGGPGGLRTTSSGQYPAFEDLNVEPNEVTGRGIVFTDV